MELLEAKSIFKIQDKFGQAELDTFYGFEKNLLLQKLSDEATEEELNHAQEALSQLERAYSVLSCELTSPSVVSDNFSTPEDKTPINPLYIGVGIGLAIAAVAYFFMSPKSSVPPATTTQTIPNTPTTANSNANKTAAEQNWPKSEQYELRKLPQQNNMRAVLRKSNELKREWDTIAESQNIILPKRITSLYEDGQDYRVNSRFSQAQLAFEDFNRALTEHIAQFKNYNSTFLRFESLSKQWLALANANQFKFSRHGHYQKKFDTVASELQMGKLPSHSRAVLEQVCFIYETTIERGMDLVKKRQQYARMRKKWEKDVLGSSFYTLTPATQELLNIADQSPYYAADFEYLQTQIYPRLLNHFKQHQ